MTSRKFHKLFGHPPRQREKELTQFHMDLAASIQAVTEEIVIKICRSLRKETGFKNICLAGGVALNSVANEKLFSKSKFKDIFIFPACADAGIPYGLALWGYYNYFKQSKKIKFDNFSICSLIFVIFKLLPINSNE